MTSACLWYILHHGLRNDLMWVAAGIVITLMTIFTLAIMKCLMFLYVHFWQKFSLIFLCRFSFFFRCRFTAFLFFFLIIIRSIVSLLCSLPILLFFILSVGKGHRILHGLPIHWWQRVSMINFCSLFLFRG